MSTFFRALEQAERDRALRESAQPPSPSPAAAPPRTAGPSDPTAAEGRPAAVSEPRPAPVVPTRPVVAPEAPVPRATPAGVEEHLVSLVAPTSHEAEQYRALRHLIEQFRASADVAVVAVTSPAAGDGKTTTAINLAGALAQNPAAHVLLVDADLRGSTLHRHLGLGDRPGRGLVDAILDPALDLEGVVQDFPGFNLAVLPAGRPTGTPYELLRSPRLAELLTAARERYSHVVLDTAPVVAFPDGRVISALVDGVLLVVAVHKTPRRLVEEALGVMENGKLLGLVFNGDDRSLAAYYPYAYSGQAASRNGGAPTGWARVIPRFRARRARPKRARG